MIPRASLQPVWQYDQRTGTFYDLNATPVRFTSIGANGAPAQTPEEEKQESGIRSAIKQITPTLILVGIVTGASFAIGSALVSHIFFGARRR